MIGWLRNVLFLPREELERRKTDLQQRLAEKKGQSSSPETDTATKSLRTSNPILLVDAACPYCGIVQDPPPQRRKKCRDCSETIYTRTDRETRKKYLMTAIQLEEHAQAEAERKAAEQAEAERRRKDAERRARQERDARWKELSKEVQRASQAGDWSALSSAHGQQARILHTEGRPHHHLSVESMRFGLMAMQVRGLAETFNLQLTTCQDERVCDYCASLDGNLYTIEEALKEMPIPGTKCINEASDIPHSGFCRCIYIPKIR